MLGCVVIDFDSSRFDEVVSTCCHLFVSLCQVFRFVFIASIADVCLLLWLIDSMFICTGMSDATIIPISTFSHTTALQVLVFVVIGTTDNVWSQQK